jgi:class 3 adenylate cyclase
VAELPRGTVTFLFTDVDHSTELVKRLQEEYGPVLAEHRAVLRAVFAEHAGAEVDTQGDAFFVAFGRARDAVASAVAAQRALAAYAWPGGVPVSIRIGLHTGEAYRVQRGYAGLAVHRAARICTLAHGGQVLLSRSTAGIIDDEEIPAVAVRDLGDYRLKDFERPERIFQLVVEGLPSHFPPLRGIEQQAPLTGTATIVMVEGRRMLGLYRELTPEVFGALLREYRRLLNEVLERSGGHDVEGFQDTVLAAFSTAKQAAWAAAHASRAVAAHEWPQGLRLAVSIGIHSGAAGVGWAGPAALRCGELCDAAEGGQIYISQTTAVLLEDEDLGELRVRDLGEQTTRRTHQAVRAYELVMPPVAQASDDA